MAVSSGVRLRENGNVSLAIRSCRFIARENRTRSVPTTYCAWRNASCAGPASARAGSTYSLGAAMGVTRLSRGGWVTPALYVREHDGLDAEPEKSCRR